MRLSYLLTFALAATCSAQDASMGTPALGFAFDASIQAIRAIRGIPGAALVEDALEAGFPITSAAISPRQEFALVTAGDSSVRLLRLNNGRAAAALLDGAMAAPERMILSSGGHAALLYGFGRLQSVSGLPDRPVVRDWTQPSLSAAPTALAISDDGGLVAVAAGSQDSDSVSLWNSDGSFSNLSLPGSTVAVAFHSTRRDLIALAANGDLYLVRDAGANAPYRMFHAAGTPDGTAVQFSADGNRAFTADGAGNLSVIDLDTAAMSRLSCGCRADSLEPTRIPNLFRVTPVSDLPLLLFDASRLVPRVWFVPRDLGRLLEGAAQ